MTSEIPQPNPWMILPFGALLASIALGPLLTPKWWHHHFPKVAGGLGAVTLFYYLGVLHANTRVFHAAHEYVSFIALIGSLFVVSGGIHITVKGESTPLENTLFLFAGAILANVLGTTGASMLMIRPWIRMNRYRITNFHVVMFIFIVSNVGGCLTPIGDPPLFLGYLKGIPFWWVAEACWPMWLVGIAYLLAVFYILDRRNYLRAPKPVREALAEPPDVWKFNGLINLVFLAVILVAVFIESPIFLREAVMISAAAASYILTHRSIHESNDFNFFPLQEVAILFVGIFATMMPALDWLELNAAKLGSASPGIFYWGSGSLSAVLDNAPTYLSFLSASFGLLIEPQVIEQTRQVLASGAAGLASLSGNHAEEIRATIGALQKYHGNLVATGEVSTEQIEVAYLLGNLELNAYIKAISIGSVFFGALTYIGNGPNFMVKSIAVQQKVHTPNFIRFVVRYSLPILLPLLIGIWLIFFS